MPGAPDPNHPPFTLPLDAPAFHNALAAGHGRAWLHALHHNVADVKPILLHAMLHSLAWDLQTEDDRGDWLVGLIDAADAGDDLYPAFLSQVHDIPEGNRDQQVSHLSQRGTILARLHARGIPGAADAVERMFRDNRSRYPDKLVGALDLIEVRADEGLVMVAAVLGNEAQKTSADVVEDWFMNVFDDGRGDGAARRILEGARAEEPGVDHFLQLRESMRQHSVAKQTQSDALSTQQVIDWVRTTPWRTQHTDGWIWLGAWGRKADDSALRAIIDALEETDDPIQQTRFLWIFRARPMPHVSDRTLNLAIASDDTRRTAASRALRHEADPRVRAFALQHLNARSLARGILDLLAPNFEPGDCRRIEEHLDIPDERSERHRLTSDLADYCEAVQRSECLKLLLFTYEHSPCALARERVTDVMADLELCPARLADEGRYDAAESIRERFGGPKLDA